MTGQATSMAILGPIGGIGRRALDAVRYIGRLGMLLVASIGAVARPGPWEDAPGWTSEARWMLGMGLPIAALVHVGMGSFLSMQAYFGGTFVDGTGAVVGVGLFRNVAPLLSGFIVAGLFSARLTPRFQAMASPPPRPPREGFLSRTEPGKTAEPEPEPIPIPPRAGAVLVGAFVCGPILAFWSASVGTFVGWRVSQSMLGVSTESFFGMFLEMVWRRDVVGVFVKGAAYAMVAALFAMHEGILAADRQGGLHDRVGQGAFRATCFAAMVMLFLNSSWFLLFYLAGPAFGPTLLSPPTS